MDSDETQELFCMKANPDPNDADRPVALPDLAPVLNPAEPIIVPNAPEWPLAPLEYGAYRMIMCDPPWSWAAYSDRGLGRSPQSHYSCMSLDDIKALPISSLAHPDGAWLWLWATAPMYDFARECVDAWGATYSTQGVWVKTTKAGLPAFGMGHVLRNAHEPYIIARFGRPKVMSRSIRSVIMEQRREHSRKPEAAYRDAERLVGPGARMADVFARQLRLGWDAFGLEADKFGSVQPDLPFNQDIIQ
ncbi:MT-A70 family methyltransferase [Methylobacterium indicum]|uniref:MT-A70 family methyltransferase n=1 Tax=Methylobacterium indicum TaxID=1775910 RepID=UPI001FD0F10F|nr:MT-A70 family methyltransferase [Methylobacterium indicum]